MCKSTLNNIKVIQIHGFIITMNLEISVGKKKTEKITVRVKTSYEHLL